MNTIGSLSDALPECVSRLVSVAHKVVYVMYEFGLCYKTLRGFSHARYIKAPAFLRLNIFRKRNNFRLRNSFLLSVISHCMWDERIRRDSCHNFIRKTLHFVNEQHVASPVFTVYAWKTWDYDPLPTPPFGDEERLAILWLELSYGSPSNYVCMFSILCTTQFQCLQTNGIGNSCFCRINTNC